MNFPNIDPVAFAIGPLMVRWYALAYMVGILGGWRYCVWLAQRYPGLLEKQKLDDFLLWALFGVVLGGRLGYVLFYQGGYYLENPAAILEVWQGGMSFHGGALGVILAMTLYAWRHKFHPVMLADFVVAAVPIGLFFGRLANFVNGELYGRVTDVSWGMVFPRGGPLPRHPSQLYEAGLEGLLLFAVLFVAIRYGKALYRRGMLSGLFLAGYGLSRLLVEMVREPDAQLGFLFNVITMGQLLSLPMIAAGLWLLYWSRKHTDQHMGQHDTA